MDDGFDDSYTVDFYVRGVRAAEDGVSRLKIRGKQFSREIYRPLQGHEEITGQTNFNDVEDYLYRFNLTMPHNAMDSQETLLQAIIALAPADRAYVAETEAYTFGPRMMTWQNVAQVLVGRVPVDSFGGMPCVILAEEIFGHIRVRSEANRWITRDLGAVPIKPDMWCAICKTDVTDTPAEELTRFNVCAHVFHKACIYHSIGNLNFDTVICPVCASPIA